MVRPISLPFGWPRLLFVLVLVALSGCLGASRPCGDLTPSGPTGPGSGFQAPSSLADLASTGIPLVPATKLPCDESGPGYRLETLQPLRALEGDPQKVGAQLAALLGEAVVSVGMLPGNKAVTNTTHGSITIDDLTIDVHLARDYFGGAAGPAINWTRQFLRDLGASADDGFESAAPPSSQDNSTGLQRTFIRVSQKAALDFTEPYAGQDGLQSIIGAAYVTRTRIGENVLTDVTLVPVYDVRLPRRPVPAADVVGRARDFLRCSLDRDGRTAERGYVVSEPAWGLSLAGRGWAPTTLQFSVDFEVQEPGAEPGNGTLLATVGPFAGRARLGPDHAPVQRRLRGPGTRPGARQRDPPRHGGDGSVHAGRLRDGRGAEVRDRVAKGKRSGVIHAAAGMLGRNGARNRAG